MSTAYRHSFFRYAWVGLWVLLLSAPAGALSVVQRSFDELVSLSELVLVGTVSELRSGYDTPDRNIIHTQVILTDLEVVKGRLDTAQYTLRIAGGRVGDRIDVYPGLPQLQPGQRYVLFIRGNFRDFFPVVGIQQGIYQVLKDGAGRQVVLPTTGAETRPVLPAAQLDAHPETLAAFLRRVRSQLITPAVTP